MQQEQAPRFVSAAEITRNFGLWQDRAAQGPLLVTHHGRPRCVLLTMDQYQAMAAAAPLPAAGNEQAARREIEHGLLAERIEGGFVALDAHFRIAAVTSLGALLLGQPAARLQGQALADVLTAFESGPAAAGLRRVQRTGEEARFDLPVGIAGEERLEVRAFPWPAGVAMILRRVADRDDGDRSLSEAAALAAARGAHGRSGVARLTVRATIASAEPGFAALAGFAPERLAGVRLIDLLALPARVALAEAIERVLGGGGAEALDSRLLVNNGDETPVRLAFAALADGYAVGGAMVMMTPLG
ncbi:MAG TPA: PAS domain-containing protein [Sphingomonas sp.]